MKRALLYIVLGFGTAAIAILALGQQSPTKTPPGPPSTPPPAPAAASAHVAEPALPAPPIPDADRADFFQRQTELMEAQQALQLAQQGFQTAVQKLAGDCGDKYVPQLVQAGGGQAKKLVCAARPAVPAPTAKKGN